MPHTRTIAGCTMTLVAAAGALAVAPGGGFEWNGNSSNLWFDSENWTFNGEPTSSIPGCGDDQGVNISIPESDDIIVVRCAAESTIVLGALDSAAPMDIARRLILNDDSILNDFRSVETFSLEANADVTIQEINNTWDRGTFDGTSAITIADQLDIRGVGSRGLSTFLFNDGVVLMDAGITITNWQGVDGRIINNGTWMGQGTINRSNADTARFNLNGFARGLVLPDGTATGALRFAVPLDIDEAGTIQAQTTDVRISFGGDHQGSGSYQCAEDNSIIIDPLPGFTPLSILGTYDAQGTGQLHLMTELNLFGNLTTNLDEESSQGFYLDSESVLNVIGSGSLTNSGKMTWKAGTITSTEDVTNTSSGVINIIGGGTSTPSLGDGTSLMSTGTWKQQGQFRLNTNATLTISSGAAFELRSNRVIGDGLLAFSNSGLLLHPIDAPPGFVEIQTTMNMNNAQIINETGELRLSGGGTWNGVSVQCDAGAHLRILGDTTSTIATTFNGDGVVDIEAQALLNISASEFVNNLGVGKSKGLFRLGDSNGGELLFGGEATSIATNNGDFRLRGGNLSVGQVEFQDGGGFIINGGFFNHGIVTTEGSNSMLQGGYINLGETFFNHSVQVPSFSLLTAQDGLIKQTSATVTVFDNSNVYVTNGTWELNGNNANINGDGTVVLFGGALLKKTGDGIATISSSLELDSNEDSSPVIEILQGTLRIQSWTEKDFLFASCRIWSGARLELGDSYVKTGPPSDSVLPEIGGTIAIALGETNPPAFSCGTLNLGGRIKPGDDDNTSLFNLDANLEMEDTAIFAANIAGDIPGSSHDQLVIDGTALLDGQLDIILLDEFTPTVGQSFTIATSTGTMTGDFDQITGPGQWSAEIVGNALIVTMDVEPTCDGDFADGNGSVDVNELLLLLAAWGFAPSSPADLDGNDVVDINDLLQLLAIWGPCDA